MSERSHYKSSKCFFRLSVSHILSQASPNWKGLKGRINKQLVDELLPKPDSDKNILLCACGPTAFTEEALRYTHYQSSNCRNCVDDLV